MLENCLITYTPILRSFSDHNYSVEIHSLESNKKEIFLLNLDKTLPYNVVLVDDLINKAKLSKLSFDEFKELNKDILEYIDVVDFYDNCLITHAKLSELFGNYEEKWGTLVLE